jgi:hypothetical protein
MRQTTTISILEEKKLALYIKKDPFGHIDFCIISNDDDRSLI